MRLPIRSTISAIFGFVLVASVASAVAHLFDVEDIDRRRLAILDEAVREGRAIADRGE